MKKKICFIGAGKTMQKHLEVFSKFKNLEFVGIYNRTKRKAHQIRKKFKINRVFNNIDEMYSLTKSNYVIVVVSPDANFKIIRDCLKYPWTIFTEKPLGLNYVQAKNLIRLSLKKKRKLFIALNRRNFISTKKLVEIIDKKKNIKRNLEIYDQQSPSNIYFTKKVINNWQFANSIHLIDYISLICRGKVSSYKKKLIELNSKQKVLECVIKFSSGDTCKYRALWFLPGKWQVKVRLDKLIYTLKPLERLKVSEFNKSNFSDLKLNYSLDNEFKPGFFSQAKNLINDNKKSNLVDNSKYIKTNNLIKLIYG